MEIHIIFDGPPEHKGGRIVDVVDADGKEIKVGRWEDRGEYWHLILEIEEPEDAMEDKAALNAVGKLAIRSMPPHLYEKWVKCRIWMEERCSAKEERRNKPCQPNVKK